MNDLDVGLNFWSHRLVFIPQGDTLERYFSMYLCTCSGHEGRSSLGLVMSDWRDSGPSA